MHSFLRTRTVLLAALCSLGLAVLVPSVSATVEPAKPKPGVPGKRGFRLFARTLGAMTVNRVLCGLNSDGEICVDSTNSSTIGGGFWPKGTADQYVFNSGLQIAGIVGSDGGDWAGDTTGAFFFDPKGTTQHGEEVEPIYNTNNPDDLAFMQDTLSTDPVSRASRVPDVDATAQLYNPLLRGRAAASQGDVWWLSWDGNPSLSAGRPHPLGILVEQRGLGWNYPVGNEDILYFVYTFYNVTASDPAVYTGAGARPGMAEILARQGQEFQDKNEQAFGVDLPDGGYTINSMFAAFSADPDVAEATVNYSSVNVPFALGYTYARDFAPAAGWTFDPGIFSPPFFPGSGFFGVKYLKSPVVNNVEVGLTLFSNTINGGAFDDAQNTTQLYRYISNNISVAAGDANCNTGTPQTTHICFVNNTAADDMRFFQSSGPLQLAPGQFGSIVVAYIFAAPVASGACTGPGVCTNQKPGDPTRLSNPTLLAQGANTIDTLAGFAGFRGADENGAVVQDSIDVVPGSLLGKALVAQQVFNGGFLLPFAPDSPEFFLIPSDNQVTVVWRPSVSEVNGDPFFTIASNPLTPEGAPSLLFDPNYRQFDVEGYRVYRGRVDSPNQLSLVAQFDYVGTTIKDFAGQINPVPGCAPELAITTECPVTFDVPTPGVAPTVSVEVPLVGPVVQVKRGERSALATGEAIVLHADTATTGGTAGFPALRDTGIPFTFIDRGVRSNLRYFYSVTAFDINSFQSGPASIESPRATKPVTPVASSPNFQNNVSNVTTAFTGRGQVLDSTAPNPTIDPATGTFSGPFPPANGWDVGIGALATQILTGETDVSARLDSISLGSPYQGVPHKYWFTVASGGSTGIASVPILQPEEIGVTTASAGAPAVPIDPSLASRFGGSADFKLSAAATVTLPGPDYLALYGRGCVNGRDGFTEGDGCAYNGSRWFAGPSPQNNETQADPIACNTGNNSGTPMSCYNNAGALPGVTTIYQTQCYQAAGGAACRPLAGIQSGAKRAADFNLYWGAGGVIDSVIDVTHNVPVPFDSVAGGTWGVLNQSATAVGAGLDASPTLTNADFACVEPFRTYAAGGFLCPVTPTVTPPYRLANTAVPGPVGFFSGGAYPPTATIVPGTSPGFALYISGDMFTFELAGGTLPAAGTVWALRQYVGAISGGNGSAGPFGPYIYSNPEGVRPLTAVGTELNTRITIVNNVAAATSNDLTRVHTVPDPYYVTSEFEQTTDTKIIKFVNLPTDAIIRIYSSSGVLVSMLEHHSDQFGGAENWNVRNRNNQVVASGVYFYHIEAGDARRVGRFTIVNFAE